MRSETVRMVADWLADATYGVNAALTALPTLSGLTRLTTRGTIPVYDETRTAEIARGQMPEDPACVVVSTSGAAMQRASAVTYLQPAMWTLEIAVRWRLQLLKTVDTSLTLAAYESQMVEAVDASLTRLLTAPEGATARTTSDVQCLGAESVRVETFASTEDSLITGAWIGQLRVRSLKLWSA